MSPIRTESNDRFVDAPKVLVVFYSTYLHTYKLALNLQVGLNKAGCNSQLYLFPETLSKLELKKMRAPPKPELPIITPQLLEQADGIVLGYPTRYGTYPAQVAEFLAQCSESWKRNSLYGKFVSTFNVTATQHGGQETSSLSLIPALVHLGMVFVPIGSLCQQFHKEEIMDGGSPYGAGVIAGKDGRRQPSTVEVKIAQAQGELFGKIVQKNCNAFQIQTPSFNGLNQPLATQPTPTVTKGEKEKLVEAKGLTNHLPSHPSTSNQSSPKLGEQRKLIQLEINKLTDDAEHDAVISNLANTLRTPTFDADTPISEVEPNKVTRVHPTPFDPYKRLSLHSPSVGSNLNGRSLKPSNSTSNFNLEPKEVQYQPRRDRPLSYVEASSKDMGVAIALTYMASSRSLATQTSSKRSSKNYSLANPDFTNSNHSVDGNLASSGNLILKEPVGKPTEPVGDELTPIAESVTETRLETTPNSKLVATGYKTSPNVPNDLVNRGLRVSQAFNQEQQDKLQEELANTEPSQPLDRSVASSLPFQPSTVPSQPISTSKSNPDPNLKRASFQTTPTPLHLLFSDTLPITATQASSGSFRRSTLGPTNHNHHFNRNPNQTNDLNKINHTHTSPLTSSSSTSNIQNMFKRLSLRSSNSNLK